MRILAPLIPVMLVLTACGGGGGGSMTKTPMLPPPVSCPDGSTVPHGQTCPEPPEPTVSRLAFPLPRHTGSVYDPVANVTYYPDAIGLVQHYGVDKVPAQTAADSRQMPVYHDTYSHQASGFPIALDHLVPRRHFVGVDQGQWFVDAFEVITPGSPTETHHIQADLPPRLPVVGEREDTEIRHARLSDGAGRGSVLRYLHEASGVVRRYSSPPHVRLIGSASAEDIDRVARAVQLVNTALPEGAKLQMGAPLPDFSLRSDVRSDGLYYRSGREHGDTIHVEFVPDQEFRRSSGATTWNNFDGNEIESSYIYFRKGVSYGDDRQGAILLAHELLHALGLYGHVSSSFASILEGTGEIYAIEQSGREQPISLLYPVDREALRVLYGLLEPGDSPEALGPWSSNAWRMDGNGVHANFGVAWRNGYAEPWANGYLPDMSLADNRTLSGSATWIGTLLGFTPDAEPVAGDAVIGVDLGTLAGRADFTALEQWAVGKAPGDVGTGVIWGDGDLGYLIAVQGNTFKQTGGDEGFLTGIFTGASHEGAAGTLERLDLVAAFGATRQ